MVSPVARAGLARSWPGVPGGRALTYRWLLPLAPADQDLVRGGLESDGEAEETLEGDGRRAASIEAEHELVEVGLEVLPAQPVVDTEAPPLGVREHPVPPGQHQVGR